MASPYRVRPSLMPQVCIVDRCLMPVDRYGCLCNTHFMRWYLHGTFRTQAEKRRRLEDMAYGRGSISGLRASDGRPGLITPVAGVGTPARSHVPC